MNRIFYTLLSCLLISTMGMAQAPQGFKYQAIVRDASQQILNNTSVGVQIKIKQGSANGTTIYTETFTPTSNAYGLINLVIGKGNTTDDFDLIDWSTGDYFVETGIDPNGGSSYTISGTSQLMSVPFSLQSSVADSLKGGIVETDPDFNSSPAASITNANKTSWNNKLSSEVDGSVTNEIQTLSFSNNILSLSNGGGTADLASLDSPWSSSTGLIYTTANKVAIGQNAPSSSTALTVKTTENFNLIIDNNRSTTGSTVGVKIDMDNLYTASHTSFGLDANVYKTGAGGDTYGGSLRGRNYTTSGSGNAYGLYSYAYKNSSVVTGTTYALYAYPSGPTTKWAGYFVGNTYSTGSYQGSDEKLKTNITAYETGLSTLMKVKTYTYTYDQSKYGFMNLPEGEQIGFIAQDVQQKVPSLTTEVTQPAQIMPIEDAANAFGEGNYTINEDSMAVVGEEVEFIGVNYAGFTPVIVQAIQEQQKIIDSQKEELAELRKLMIEMNKQLEELKK